MSSMLGLVRLARSPVPYDRSFVAFDTSPCRLLIRNYRCSLVVNAANSDSYKASPTACLSPSASATRPPARLFHSQYATRTRPLHHQHHQHQQQQQQQQQQVANNNSLPVHDTFSNISSPRRYHQTHSLLLSSSSSLTLTPNCRGRRGFHQLALFGGRVRASDTFENEDGRKLRLIMGCSTSKVSSSTSPAKKSGGSSSDEYIEGVVCKASDIGENEMKAFELGEVGKVLVVRQNGVLSALGSKCTHYGAPLETGALGDGRVRCPWHGACFNLKTGDIEDFPGVDSLPCFQVEVVDNNVKVRASKSELKASKRVKPMAALNASDRGQIIIIGGGPSGNSCAETLRQNGYTGKITMLCKEKFLPYDRVKISKILDAPIEQIQMRNEDFYKQHSIDMCRNNAAQSLDTANRKVVLADGTCMPYSKLYIATGSTALKPRIPGVDLGRIFTLRDYEDAQKVHGVLDGEKEVVVLGASFIAMEAAAYCQGKAKKVTVVGRDSVPFQKLLGAEIGGAVMKLFEEKGVNFIMNSGISEFQGVADSVQKAKLTSGEVIKADIVILGTGSTLNTEFVKDTDVNMNSHGAIEVDEFLQTNVPNIYAGGDVANAPVFAWDNKKSAIGHFGLAQYHGRIAGLNMAGKQTCQETVPFFWTMLFGHGIRYCGHGSFDEILYSGDVKGLKYAAYFLNSGTVTAVSTCILPGAAEFANRMASGRKLYRQDLGANYSAWMNKDQAMKTSL